MNLLILAVTVLLFTYTHASYAFDLNDVIKETEKLGKRDNGVDEKTKVSGLKEALSVGTEKAVKQVSQVNGYFENQAIKIPLPDEIKNVMDALVRIGFKKQVDEFVLSMNRGAEKAAPQAASIFVNAVKAMTIADAGKILLGDDTAATEYFKTKTHDDIYKAFKPVISASLDSVGATKAYKSLMDKAKSVPFLERSTVDLDHYVANKAIDGLFYMVGQEEKKIRIDPAARGTELLRTVFGAK